MLSHFSRVRLCTTPETEAHQAPPSLEFSRQEHWSGLPFPSPMHESEKWKWSRSVLSDPQRSHGLQPTRLLHPWGFPGKSTGVGCHCLLHERWLGRGYSVAVNDALESYLWREEKGMWEVLLGGDMNWMPFNILQEKQVKKNRVSFQWVFFFCLWFYATFCEVWDNSECEPQMT